MRPPWPLSDKSGSRRWRPRAVAEGRGAVADQRPCMTNKRPEPSLLPVPRTPFVSLRWVIQVRLDGCLSATQPASDLGDRQVLLVAIVPGELCSAAAFANTIAHITPPRAPLPPPFAASQRRSYRPCWTARQWPKSEIPPTECRSVVRRHRARWSMADFWIASIASGEPASTGCSELANSGSARSSTAVTCFSTCGPLSVKPSRRVQRPAGRPRGCPAGNHGGIRSVTAVRGRCGC